MAGKKHSLGTKMLACFMSVVMAVGLMPLPAYAGDAGAGDAGDASASIGEGETV